MKLQDNSGLGHHEVDIAVSGCASGEDTDDDLPDAAPEFLDFNLTANHGDSVDVGDAMPDPAPAKHVNKLELVQMNMASMIDNILASAPDLTQEQQATEEVAVFQREMTDIRRCATTLNHSMLAQVKPVHTTCSDRFCFISIIIYIILC